MIIPAALNTLEKIVIKLPAGFDENYARKYGMLEDYERELHATDRNIGAEHRGKESPNGDFFLVWTAPFRPFEKLCGPECCLN